ncbi:MAG: hypothetical protein B6U75_02370 [Desulfurococcales archaeon ex4484_217_1]|nr:MAG: hypothetical protein B6U75_02370 [Desulfurococcales archaeon ex4484_217_1]
MTTVIEISGLLEKQLQLLVDIGLYSSKTEAVRDAIRRLLNAVNIADIAVNIYAQGKISLAYASELAEQSIPDFFIKLLGKGIAPKLINVSRDIDEVVENMNKRKTVVFDVSSLYSMYLSETLNTFRKILTQMGEKKNIKTIVASETVLHLKFIELKRLISFGHRSPTLPLMVVEVNSNDLRKFKSKFLKEQCLTLAEVASQYLADKLNGILVTDDFKALEVTGKTGIYAISTPTLLDYAKYYGVLSNVEYLNAKEKLITLYSTTMGERLWRT